MEYSKRLGDITNDQLQKALSRFHLGTLQKAQAIPFGLFGQNIFLTSDKGEYVLRGNPHYSWQFPSEKFFADILYKKTSVRVPHPYLLDKKKDIFGWNYLIMPRLYGINLADEKVRNALPFTARKSICIAIAKTLAAIQTVTWDVSGEFSEEKNTIIPFQEPFYEWVYNRIRLSLNKASKADDQTTSEDKKWVETILQQGNEAMRIPFHPTIVMEDYREGNLAAGEIQGNWQVTGVFDLMELYMGDGEISLFRSIAGYYEEQKDLIPIFLDTFFSQQKKRDGFEKRFPIYMLLDRVKIWEYGHRSGRWKKTKGTFRDWCEAYLSLYDSR